MRERERHVLDSGKCSCNSKHEQEFELIRSFTVRAKTCRKEEHFANLPLHLVGSALCELVLARAECPLSFSHVVHQKGQF